MDCWPCNSVNNVQEVTDPMLPTQLQNAPFIYEVLFFTVFLRPFEEYIRMNIMNNIIKFFFIYKKEH